MTNEFPTYTETVTVQNGVAELELDTYDLEAGEYSITATYNGTDNYKSTTATASLFIDDVDTYLSSLTYSESFADGLNVMAVFDVGNSDLNVYGSYIGSSPAEPSETFLDDKYCGYFIVENNDNWYVTEISGYDVSYSDYLIEGRMAEIGSYLIDKLDMVSYCEKYDLLGTYPPEFTYAIDSGIFEIVFEGTEAEFGEDTQVALILTDGAEIYSACSDGLEEFLEYIGLN